MTLILVKHAPPHIEEAVPARLWHLSAEGRVRAERLAERLARFNPVTIFASDEPKASETAHIVAARLGIIAQSAAGLHEHDRSTTGYLERADFEASVQRFFDQPDRLVFGNETADAAYVRFASAVSAVLASIPADPPNGTTVIVAHGTVISLWVARHFGIAPYPLWARLGLPSFVVVDVEEAPQIIDSIME